MDILIVGGGIAGLSLANHLEEQLEWNVHIVEKARQFDRVGYGLGLWRNGIRIVADLGLSEPLLERSVDVDVWEMRRADGSLLNSFPVGSCDGDSDLVVLHRADLHGVLYEGLEQTAVQMGVSVQQLRQDGESVQVDFTDGTCGRFDLVVAADGIDSRVRELTFDGWTIEEFDTISMSLWAPEDSPDIEHPLEWLGPGGATMLMVPVGSRTMVNCGLVLDRQTPVDDPLELLRTQSQNFGWVIPGLVEAIDDDAPVFWTRNREVHAGNWYNDRVVLIGDAAHALHPIVGMGATLALEDSRLLYELLRDKAPENIDVALRQYEARRMKRLRRFARLSTISRKVLMTRSKLVAAARDFLLARSSSMMELFVSDVDPVGGERRTPL